MAATTPSLDVILDWVRDPSHRLPDGRIVPVCVWGERGVGKSQAIRGYCTRKELGFRGYHPAHDRTGADIVGLAYMDETIQRTVYARPLWLPGVNDPVVFDNRGVIFIDELNRAPDPVLAGLMEPLGEGTVQHSGWKIPPDWGFVCASNPPRAGYSVQTLDESMMDRLLHVPMGFDVTRWAAWANRENVAKDLISFTTQHASLVADADADLPEAIDVKMTPRSIEYLARLYEPEMDERLLKVLALGLIGQEATDAFFSYRDDPDRPLQAQEIFSGKFEERLRMQVIAGRDDLISATYTMLVATMAQYKAADNAAEQVGKFLSMLSKRDSQAAWSLIVDQAPHWQQPLEAVARALASEQRAAQT